MYALLQKQIAAQDSWTAEVYNVGGGRAVSTSMQELTLHCRQAVGRDVLITGDPTTSPVDIPIYISDHSRATDTFGWQPARSVSDIITEIATWIQANETQLRPLFAP